MDHHLCCSLLRKGVVYSIVCSSILESVQLEDKAAVLKWSYANLFACHFMEACRSCVLT